MAMKRLPGRSVSIIKSLLRAKRFLSMPMGIVKGWSNSMPIQASVWMTSGAQPSWLTGIGWPWNTMETTMAFWICLKRPNTMWWIAGNIRPILGFCNSEGSSSTKPAWEGRKDLGRKCGVAMERVLCMGSASTLAGMKAFWNWVIWCRSTRIPVWRFWWIIPITIRIHIMAPVIIKPVSRLFFLTIFFSLYSDRMKIRNILRGCPLISIVMMNPSTTI